MLLRLALRNLLRNVRRTVALVLTVAMGTGSLFLFHGFNNGIMNQYRDNTIHARFGYGQIQTRGYGERVYERPWEHWIEHPQALRSELLALPGVRQVFPRVEFPALLTSGRITVSGKGQGVDGPEEYKFFNTLNFVAGSNLSSEPEGIVLGIGMAHGLGTGVGDPVTVLVRGARGEMNRAVLRVTGVFHTGLKEFDDSVFRIPLKVASGLLETDRVESIALGLAAVEDFPGVDDFIRTHHPELVAIPFSVLDEVYYQHSVDWLDAQFGIIQLIIVAIVVLGIFNTVSTGILERKQEIGTLRANGESRYDILRMLGLEGLTLGVLGAVLGIALVVGLDATILSHGILMPPAPGITRQFLVMLEFTPLMAATTAALGISAALVATLVAGMRVTRMGIAEALRAW
ncbi:MAG: FtsX-like permease family protein [Gammaproteobacteria bacterium]